MDRPHFGEFSKDFREVVTSNHEDDFLRLTRVDRLSRVIRIICVKDQSCETNMIEDRHLDARAAWAVQGRR